MFGFLKETHRKAKFASEVDVALRANGQFEVAVVDRITRGKASELCDAALLRSASAEEAAIEVAALALDRFAEQIRRSGAQGDPHTLLERMRKLHDCKEAWEAAGLISDEVATACTFSLASLFTLLQEQAILKQ